MLKPFFLILGVCCYLIFLFLTAIYQDKVTHKEQLVRVDQHRAVSIRKSSLMEDFNVPFADIKILADVISYELANRLLSDSLSQRILYTFAKNKRGYGQVRLLDADGVEIVRINRNKGQLHVVPHDKLQSKIHRAYVQSSLRLRAGEVYVSPLDLNIENQKIEVPHVPVIRFGTPVINSYGERLGVVILNFYASQMLEHFRDIASDSLSNAMLLNDEGYWLASDNKEACWAFMFVNDDPSMKEQTFAKKYPVIWKLTEKGASGQVRNGDGLFTWTTVSPSFAVNSHADSTQRLAANVEVSPYQWIVMQHVSNEKLAAMENSIFRNCVWTWVVLSLITAITLWFTMHSIQQSQEHREELEVRAHHDWLTGLSNLPHLFSKLEQACKKAEMGDVRFFIMYIDLDDFKFVNDRYGHEAGNIVLRHVASVLRKKVRLTDTVARIGGDEYVILLEGLAERDKAAEIAFGILQAFETPVTLECGSKVYIKSSIGIAGWNKAVTGPDDLMKCADAAMYNSKHGGKNRVSVYPQLENELAV